MNLDSAILYTTDIAWIRKFYEEVVGLRFEYQDGEHYVSFVFPNGARLGINKPSEAFAQRDTPGHQTVFIRVTDIEAQAKKYQDLGFDFFEPLEHHYWGSFFAILDPDNNKIGFIQDPK